MNGGIRSGASMFFSALVVLSMQWAPVRAATDKAPSYGFIDKTGKMAIPPRFQSASDFREGLAVVKLLGKYGYADNTGNVVIPPAYEGAEPFSEGLAAVKVRDPEDHYELYGFIDKSGKMVISPQFEKARPMSEGVAAVQLSFRKRKGLGKDWGYVDKTGKMVIEPAYSEATSFKGGLAGVKSAEGAGLIDRDGNFVLQPKYSSIVDNSDGVWTVLRSTGSMVRIGRGYNQMVSGGLFGFVDKSGKVLIKPQFDGISGFSEGLACVASGEWNPSAPLTKWAYVDQTGKVAVKGDFNMGRPFSEGLAPVAKGRWQTSMFNMSLVNATWGFVDKTGKLVIPQQYDDARPFSEGLAAVTADDKLGFIDKGGKLVVATQFDDAGDFSEGLAWVKTSDPKLISAVTAPSAKETDQANEAWVREVVTIAKGNWESPEDTAHPAVVVVMTLNKHGGVEEVTVSKSSGDEDYDQTAIDACHETSLYPRPPESVPVPVRVEITFRHVVKGAATPSVPPSTSSAEDAAPIAQKEKEIKAAMELPQVRKAYELMTNGNMKEALPAFQAALTVVGPDSPKAIVIYSGRGALHVMQREYGTAVEDFDRALALLHISDAELPLAKRSPNVAAVVSTCFNARYMSNLLGENYEAAVADDRRLSLWKPQSDTGEPHLFRGFLYSVAGKPGEAMAEFDLASAAGPEIKELAKSGKELAEELQNASEADKKMVLDRMKKVLKARLEPLQSEMTVSAAANKARDAACRANMRTLQIGVEMYATDHGGRYPTKLDRQFDLLVQKSKPGVNFWPAKNPFTGRAESPVMGTVTSVQKARAAERGPLAPGVVEYSTIAGGKSYAIRGGGHDGKALPPASGQFKTLVLSPD